MLEHKNPVQVTGTAGSIEPEAKLRDIDIQLILDAIRIRYGYDFNQSRPSCVSYAISVHARENGYDSIAALILFILQCRAAYTKLFMDISVGVTGMFRDPFMYIQLRWQVLPALRTYPFLNIWHAGCATGEEAYSTAIFLKEEGLLPRSRIYTKARIYKKRIL